MIRVIVRTENRVLLEMIAPNGGTIGSVEIQCKPDVPRDGFDTIEIVTAVDHDGVHVITEVQPS